MSLPPKQRVRDSFDRAAVTYDAAAVLQREVCQQLLSGFDPDPEPVNLVDAGCGTGYGLQLLRTRWPCARLLAVDFAPAMVSLASPHADFSLVGDVEALPCADQSFTTWWSNLTLQWCRLDCALAEAWRVLRPGGELALSTLGPGTFHELRLAFSSIDPYRHTLTFSDPPMVSAALLAAGFEDLRLQRQPLTVHYPDLRALLRAVKDIGANAIGDGGRSSMFGRRAWSQLQAAYEEHRTPSGLPAHYDVLFAYARKPT